MIRGSCAAAALAVYASAVAAETQVERGEYLVRGIMGCGNCHTPLGPDGFVMEQELGGRLVEDIEPFTAYAPNITPAGRISEWSDEELAKSIREGIRPDGSIIGPPMPFSAYRHLSDEDLGAVVAFLRTLEPVENEVPPSEYRIELPPAYGPPVESVSAPEAGATAEYGEYLSMAVAHCMECHTPMTPMGPDYENSLGRGGFEFHGPWGTSVSSNLTDHPDGLADYTDDEIKTIIVEGKRPDGEAMMPPMPYPFLARMSEQDLDAIVLYLRSLPGMPDA
jgi:mono/diheme cytochrome c family protein